jgi:nucleoside-specific outer membrane channel protein Tsx
MIRKKLILLLFLCSEANAFSTTDIQLLYGNFDGNSYIYDTNNGGKSTVTLENFMVSNIGSIYTFIDYSIANDKFKFHDNKIDVYGEISPRLSLSYLTNKNLSTTFIKDFYFAGEYNLGTTNSYRAYLYGLGIDIDLYGFDNFGLNVYVKNQNIGKNTLQLTGFYSTHVYRGKFSFSGYFDWTELDFTTQNQFLYKLDNISDSENIYIGFEWLLYSEKPSELNFNSNVKSNVLQIMLKYEW